MPLPPVERGFHASLSTNVWRGNIGNVLAMEAEGALLGCQKQRSGIVTPSVLQFEASASVWLMPWLARLTNQSTNLFNVFSKAYLFNICECHWRGNLS